MRGRSRQPQKTSSQAESGFWSPTGDLLTDAKVRAARLHDARHTAATMLLVLKVPTRAVMDVMGWSQASMAKRYQHVPTEVLTGIADLVGGLLWQTMQQERDDGDDGPAGALSPTG
ncbi:hypothetical protein FMEAI12_4280062 [Parafrankia sp. Ea1.12]|nr:tyrosine-type recombinase/integrase [Parafrankia sp. Ea1.12]SQD97756.1 hypothetical protein FMEAI12_4280062 [Parafrankia sp. Ea1.12]